MNVTREEKLIAQMKNIESVLQSNSMSPEMKVYQITQNMSYLNALINNILRPLKEQVVDTQMIEMANETFTHFNTNLEDQGE
ncbi:hypothetical protein P8918_13780 [Bacillus spizizenii]|nr:hypothetical protein [Bacillus spizizenii]MCY8890374.1 hypothetical protein [Bacillus spizizenii]MEC0842099.1 hypothetical protein [Bacillus spizizenii]